MAKTVASASSALESSGQPAVRKKTVRPKPVPAAPLVEPVEVTEVLPPDRLDLIAQGLREKSSAKQAIFRATQAAFVLLRQTSQQLCLELTQKVTTGYMT